MATKDITDLQVLTAQREWLNNRGLHGYLRLSIATGQCAKVCYFAMQRAHKRGLLEYGTSLRTAWITEKGGEMLKNNIDNC